MKNSLTVHAYGDKLRKLQSFKPSLINRKLFSEYDDVSIINRGECFIWAYSACVIFKSIELWYNNNHAFVKYRGKFYDSERLKGVSDWRELPATEGGGLAFRTSIAFFKQSWYLNTIQFDTSWKKIESTARKIIRHEQAYL